MIELRTTHIKPRLPKREWLLRCTDNDHELSMFAICVSNGNIEIITADDTVIELTGSHIAEFLDAFQSAIELADDDLAKMSGIPDV
ncbi:hypothetical protein [Actinophytocola sediminis]